ncbi:MAG TPA: hypothetical protein VH227_04930 [Candidatus Udaeobacter sp.]|nr:hypothetical protein [Candidatus Udaeobacter sp.]
MNVRALQFFFVAATSWCLGDALAHASLSSGVTYSFNFTDIDGKKLSTAEGHITLLVLAGTADGEKARAVGEGVPDHCLGNADYKMITIIRFARSHTAVGRRIATVFIRHRINTAAKRLQARYDGQKIVRDAREDIFVVPDFDGTASSQLVEQSKGTEFQVLVFARDGKLLAQWTDVPSPKQLADVLK